MKIALTGVPGTGKTSVAKELKKRGYDVLSINDIADEFVVGYDEERQSKIVDEDALNEYIKKIREKGLMFIEGHLSHLLDVDAVIILRCNPEELKKRLAKKGWNERKIRENLEAEALDIILDRALEKHEKIWEIDVTEKSIEETANEIEKIVKQKPPPNYGKIDWSEWLIENVG
ncbi:MAG: adenylate kinase family protein [Thermoplasmata archaeon]|nr:adenylate kinase family protein [Thermoplasmata archaeon]